MAQAHARTSLGMELVELRAKDTGFGVESSKKKKKKQNKKKQPRESDDSEDSDDSEQNNQDSVIKWEFVPGKQYILRSTFDKKVIAKAANVEEWPDDSHTAVVDVKGSDQLSHIGILYIILALILVSGREIPDGKWSSTWFNRFADGSFNSQTACARILRS